MPMPHVAAAFAHAKKSHKRVLIDLGGNWCVRLRGAGQFRQAAGDAALHGGAL